MHDKYYYESAQLALKNTSLDRTFATGISGLSHAVDSISAIKYGHVKAIRNEDGIAVDLSPTMTSHVMGTTMIGLILLPSG